MPPSFFEDDTVDFPDDLDTSFFTRVSGDVLYLRFEKKEKKKSQRELILFHEGRVCKFLAASSGKKADCIEYMLSTSDTKCGLDFNELIL